MASRENARRFHFMREIASGGFGSVYLAKVMHADGFSRLVAIKLLHRRWSDNQEVAQRMRDEARLLGWLRHRNIVDVIDLTSIDGRAAVVMEYLEAVDVKTVIQHLAEKGQKMPPYAALEMTAFVASALEAAYNRPPFEGEKPLRVIHRDIKPSNIMVDESGTVKVLDFGVARGEFANRESHTQDLQFGSVEYMPPERLFFEPETDRADVYSLGASLFECLVGERLGKAKGRAEKHAAFLEDRLSFLAASCPLPNPQGGEVARLVREMCAYNADSRPSSEEIVLRARQLARQMPGPGLGEWSEIVVKPLVLAARLAPREPNPLTDSVMPEDSTIFGPAEVAAMLEASKELPTEESQLPGEIPREDARWDQLRVAAVAEMRTLPDLPSGVEGDFGDEPTRIGLPLPPQPDPQPEPARQPDPVPAPLPPTPPVVAKPPRPPPSKSVVSSPLPRALLGAAVEAQPLPAPPARGKSAPPPVNLQSSPFAMLPEIVPGVLDPPSAEELKPQRVRGAAPAGNAFEVAAGLERLRANMTMVPDDSEEAPTTSLPPLPRVQPFAPPAPRLPAPPAMPGRAAQDILASRPMPTPAAEQRSEALESDASGSILWGVVGFGLVGGLLLGFSYLGFRYWKGEPELAVPAVVVPDVLAAVEIQPSLTDIVFVSAAADTRSISAECGGVVIEGDARVVVPGPSVGPCLVKLVKRDRSRVFVTVEAPTAGTYSCFTADAKSCTK